MWTLGLPSATRLSYGYDKYIKYFKKTFRHLCFIKVFIAVVILDDNSPVKINCF